MEIQAQWAAKLLQEYQRRAEASGFPGPHTNVSQPAKSSPAKTMRGISKEIIMLPWFWLSVWLLLKTASSMSYISDGTFQMDSPVQILALQSKQPAGTPSESLQGHH